MIEHGECLLAASDIGRSTLPGELWAMVRLHTAFDSPALIGICMLHVTRDGDNSVRLAVKAVPGARQDEIVGVLGDRLKVRVAAPAEGGKANKAICALVAREFGVRSKDVSVVGGASDARKTVRLDGTTLDHVVAHARARWGEG